MIWLSSSDAVMQFIVSSWADSIEYASFPVKTSQNLIYLFWETLTKMRRFGR